MAKGRTEPVSLDERRATRRGLLPPDGLSEDALRRLSVGRVRWALTELAKNNADTVQEMLDAVAVVDGPKAYLEVFIKLLEFSVPKLSRAEIKVEDPDGRDSAVAQLTMDDLVKLIQEGVRLENRTVDSTAKELPDND